MDGEAKDGDEATGNVIRLPREWIGPRDELIPVTDRGRAEARRRRQARADQDAGDPVDQAREDEPDAGWDTEDDAPSSDPPSQPIPGVEDFWSGEAGAVHDAILGPGRPATRRFDSVEHPAESEGLPAPTLEDRIRDEGPGDAWAVHPSRRPRVMSPAAIRGLLPRVPPAPFDIRRPRSLLAVAGTIALVSLIAAAVIGLGEGSRHAAHPPSRSADASTPAATRIRHRPATLAAVPARSFAERPSTVKDSRTKTHHGTKPRHRHSNGDSHRATHPAPTQNAVVTATVTTPSPIETQSPTTSSSNEPVASPATTTPAAAAASTSSQPAASPANAPTATHTTTHAASTAPAGPTDPGSASGCDPHCS